MLTVSSPPPRWRWLPFLPGAILLVVTAFAVDTPVCEWMRTHRVSFWRTVAEAISDYGDWLPLAAVALAGVVIARQSANRRWVKIFLLALCAAFCTAAIVIPTRALTGRVRPSAKVEKGWYPLTDGQRSTIGRHRYSSFPSAHTANAAAVVAPLVLLGGRAFAPLLLLIIVMGWSRLYLGVHHPSDVVVGALVGWSCGWLLCRSVKVRRCFWRLAARICPRSQPI